MCGVNFTLFGCEEKILSNVHIVHWYDPFHCAQVWLRVHCIWGAGMSQRWMEISAAL